MRHHSMRGVRWVRTGWSTLKGVASRSKGAKHSPKARLKDRIRWDPALSIPTSKVYWTWAHSKLLLRWRTVQGLKRAKTGSKLLSRSIDSTWIIVSSITWGSSSTSSLRTRRVWCHPKFLRKCSLPSLRVKGTLTKSLRCCIRSWRSITMKMKIDSSKVMTLKLTTLTK